MRYKLFLLLLTIDAVYAFGQAYPESVLNSMIRNYDQTYLKRTEEYSFRINEGKMTTDSVLVRLTKNDKSGSWQVTDYDTVGKEQFHSLNRTVRSIAGILPYYLERVYRYGQFWRNDTTYSDPDDPNFYRNSTGTQKSGTKTYNVKGQMTKLELLYKYNYSDDSLFYVNMKLYYEDSLLVKRENFDDATQMFRWITYFTWDKKGRIAGYSAYDTYRHTIKKTEATYYYNEQDLLFRVESYSYDQQVSDNPHGAITITDKSVHYSYYKEYNDKRLPVKHKRLKNGILIDVKTYHYKYFE